MEGSGTDKFTLLLRTERTVTTSGGVLPAEEGVNVPDNLGSETEGTGTLEILVRFIINIRTARKASAQKKYLRINQIN